MHARVIHANISDLAEARRGLDEEFIRGIKGARGFLGAYFVAIDDSHGISIEVFETEELARGDVSSRRCRGAGGDGAHHPVGRGHRFGLICSEPKPTAHKAALIPKYPMPRRTGALFMAGLSRARSASRRQTFGSPVRDPHQLLSYRASQGRLIETPPPAVLFAWQGVLLDRVRSARTLREITGPAGAVLELSPQVGFAYLPLGAPASAIVIEELAALGMKTIVGVGTAGGLSPDLEIGKLSCARRRSGTRAPLIITLLPAVGRS